MVSIISPPKQSFLFDIKLYSQHVHVFALNFLFFFCYFPYTKDVKDAYQDP